MFVFSLFFLNKRDLSGKKFFFGHKKIRKKLKFLCKKKDFFLFFFVSVVR